MRETSLPMPRQEPTWWLPRRPTWLSRAMFRCGSADNKPAHHLLAFGARSRLLPRAAKVCLRKSPGGGPPALLMRMSGAGQAAIATFLRRHVGHDRLGTVAGGVPRTRSPCGLSSPNPCFLASTRPFPGRLLDARQEVWQSHARGLCAPHAKTRRLKAELPRPVRRLALDLVDADRVFEDHAIGALEIEKARARRRMPTGTEHNRHAALVKEIIGAQDVVGCFHLMVDVLDAGLGRPHQRNGVMDRVDAH